MIKIKNCRYGPMMFLSNDKWTGRSFDHYGEAYQNQINFMDRFINPGDWVIDAGANIGAMTIPFAKKVETVVAIEPQEFIYYTLCGNVAANNLYNVTVLLNAVSDQSGKTLYCPSTDLQNDDGVPFYDDHLQHYGGVYLTEEARFESDSEVLTIAIDDLSLSRCDFIKMDIEGNELNGLKGAQETISKFRPIMFIESMPWVLPKLSEALKGMDYVFRSCRMRFFNKNNFFEESIDYLRDESDPETPMMSSDIICCHKNNLSKMDAIYFKAMKDIT